MARFAVNSRKGVTLAILNRYRKSFTHVMFKEHKKPEPRWLGLWWLDVGFLYGPRSHIQNAISVFNFGTLGKNAPLSDKASMTVAVSYPNSKEDKDW